MRELRIIEEIRRCSEAQPRGKTVVKGIGDDCAVLRRDRDTYTLFASDMLVDGTHFVSGRQPYRKIGRKSVSVNISDIAAMGGGIPECVTVSVGLPKSISPAAVRNIFAGIFDVCNEYGIRVAGGDTVRSSCLVIDVAITGRIEKARLAQRSGARTGDMILVTGPVRDGRKEHLDFAPRLKEARYLTRTCRVNSMIDTSDGIAVDMGHICVESGTGCRIYADAVPLSAGLGLRDALYYGESFELLFTAEPSEVRKLFGDIKKKRVPPGYFIIGEVVARGEGMVLVGKEGRTVSLKMEGFRHV